MKYSRLIIFSIVCLHSSHSYGMNPFNECPKDIINLCTVKQAPINEQIYPIDKDYRETLFISSTHPIIPVKATSMHEYKPNITPTTTGNNLPNPQFWLTNGHIRSSDDTDLTDSYFTIQFDRTKLVFIDGINKYSIFAHAEINEKNNTPSTIISLNEHRRNEKKKYYATKTITHNGRLCSFTLEEENNTIIFCSLTPDNKYTISTYSFTLDNISLRLGATPHCFKKIINIGNTAQGKTNNLSDVYLGLTVDGRLVTLWYDEKNKLQSESQTNKVRFADIAVDNTAKTPGGLKPKVALLSTDNSLFFTNMAMTSYIRLYKIYALPKEEKYSCVSRISYHNGIITIVFNGTTTLKGGTFISIDDNASYYYAHSLLIGDHNTNNLQHTEISTTITTTAPKDTNSIHEDQVNPAIQKSTWNKHILYGVAFLALMACVLKIYEKYPKLGLTSS